jgi:transposase
VLEESQSVMSRHRAGRPTHRFGKKVSSKRQRGWEYLKKLGNSPKVPRFHHAKANELQQEVFKKLPMRVMRLKEAYPTAKVEL